MSEINPQDLANSIPPRKRRRPFKPAPFDLEHEVMEEKIASPDRRIGLGRRAVISHMKVADFVAEKKPPTLDENPFGMSEEMRHRKLSESHKVDLKGGRYTIEYMQEDDHEDKFNYLLTQQKSSPWLDAVLGVEKNKRGRKNYLQRLTQKNRRAEYEISEETLQNFFEWHNNAIAQNQHELNKKSELLKTDFQQRFTQAAENGWIPKAAVNHLQRLADVDLIADDGRETSIRSAYARIWRQHQYNAYLAVISPEVQQKDPGHTFIHEFIHAHEGRDEVHDEFMQADSRRFSGLHRIFSPNDGGIAMEEAVVEHLAISLKNGEVDETDPREKKGLGACYYKERRLLHMLCEGGVKQIDIRRFLAAYFENGSKAEAADETSARKQLTKKIYEAFPFPDIISEISMLEPKKLINILLN